MGGKPENTLEDIVTTPAVPSKSRRGRHCCLEFRHLLSGSSSESFAPRKLRDDPVVRASFAYLPRVLLHHAPPPMRVRRRDPSNERSPSRCAPQFPSWASRQRADAAVRCVKADSPEDAPFAILSAPASLGEEDVASRVCVRARERESERERERARTRSGDRGEKRK